MRSEHWPAPAKINLFLHVTGRRADGYHQLQTLFQFLDYGDELSFDIRPDDRIGRPLGPADVPAEQDLVVRAARALQAATGCTRGADIHVIKRIPMGAGLGGGSSDAATTLLALNQLWQLHLDTAQLAAIGLRLGADVPVFIRGQAAWAEGVGEQLQPVSPPEPWYAVITVDAVVPTRDIFMAPELRRDHAPISYAQYLDGAGSNDCTPVTCARYPAVADALAWLSQHGVARMSGTGCAVFAAFPTQAAAVQALATLPDAWQGFVARGCNRSPLHQRLALPRKAPP